jgi:membrane-associated protease RseP (regulator of RpoE activity)
VTLSSLLGVVLFILALTLAIFFHEGGHFLTAKWFGMRVERFFLGFGPTIWSFRRGETEYGLKAIPAGGFCKISGMSPYEHDHNLLESERRKPGEEPIEPAPPERQFRNKPAWQRAIVLAAGSFTHFMIALLLIYLLLVAIGQPIGPTTNEIEQVVARGEGGVAAPAGPAGLRAGDRIVEVDRKPVTNFTDLQNALKGTAGRAVPIVYERDGQRVRTTITPATIRAANGETRAFLGVQPTRDVVRMNPIAAVPESGKLLWRVGAASVGGLGSIFTGLADRFQPAEPVPAGGGGTATDSGSPVGIIGIGRLAGQAVAADQWIFFILLLIQFNVFVGIVNLLPIPPMDGGYLGFLAWEKVTGRTVDLRRVAPVAFTIVVLLVFLTVGLVYLDITNPISNPFR